jgi:magnesium chelatase family protein
VALARLISRGQAGLDAYEVAVEVHLATGLPAFTISGLPAAAVRESRDRVRAALHTCNLPPPAKRITVHLGPADIPKEGGRFDLPIALGLVKAEHELPWSTNGLEFIGELALNGELRPIQGALPAALAARDAGRGLILPTANAAEAALVHGAEVYQAAHLTEVLDHMNATRPLSPVASREWPPDPPPAGDLAEVRGQESAKRALTIAAAGAHHLLMVGPPGSGKSMLAERLPGLLPPLGTDERLCVACIASVAGKDPSSGQERPFRAPHHSLSAAALVGGGARPQPGEISLAHHGILFLDELPEFPRAALEALREPLEKGAVRVSRVRGSALFPACFQLVAAMNPCPCGYLGDGSERCRCSAMRIQQYRARLSGPLLDRFDLHVEVPRPNVADIARSGGCGESARLRELIAAARLRQNRRAGVLNARLEPPLLWEIASLPPDAQKLLERAVRQWQLSVRSANRIARVALTIADLAASDRVTRCHVAEALQLRCLDRPMPGFDPHLHTL